MFAYSIIIPHFNSVQLLRRCILSIPLRSDIQIIVVDDYSSEKENPKMLLKDLNSYNIELYYNTGIKSAGAARNVGIRHAKGKMIIFADADDYFSDTINGLLDYYKDASADIIYFKMTSVDCVTLQPADRADGYNKKLILAKASGHIDPFVFTTNSPVSKIISRDLICTNNLKFEEIVVSNDAMFSMQAAIHARNIMIDDKNTLYVVTKRTGSLDYTINRETDNIRMECAYRINKLLYKHGKGKYRRNLFGISNRLVFKWKYLFQYRNLGYLLYDFSYALYAKFNLFLQR